MLLLSWHHKVEAFVVPNPNSHLSARRTSSVATGGDMHHHHHQNHPRTVAQAFLRFPSSFKSKEDTPKPEPVKTKSVVEATPVVVGTDKPAGVKLRQLKDMMWVRETTEDLTAAEFACTVEAAATAAASDVSSGRKRKRAVDYEKLLNQLNRRIRDMGCDGDLSVPKQDDAADADSASGSNKAAPFECVLQSGVGLGSLVYTDQQRQALLNRTIRTRQMLVEVIRGHELELEQLLACSEKEPFSIALPELRVEIPKEDGTSPGPKLYVRDDGTVDWDGALQDQAALRKFGTAVWARINGQDPESISDDDADDTNGTNVTSVVAKTTATTRMEHTPKVVTAKIEDTQQIKDARSRLESLTMDLQQMERAHTALLSSAISAGQAVANVNLATLEPAQRNTIRESAEALVKMKEEVSFQTLIYELERIYTYLVGELGNPALNGYIPLQDRLNVAEFGLLESQIDSFNRLLEADESLDADVLAVVMDQLTDFKRRLGIDYYVTGLSFDREAIARWLGELMVKTKKGFAFYVKGVQLFWNDIVFCLSLINRAAQGYTLKPREVRTIRYVKHAIQWNYSQPLFPNLCLSPRCRRTFKDIITFIPVVIILIIPLSPVGHVLVFGAIQRFFPGFFPSCFTEQRQNLLQLYENAEYSEFTINENWQVRME
jgi:hypothetical protein